MKKLTLTMMIVMFLLSGTSMLSAAKAVIGWQPLPNPFLHAVTEKWIENATGYDIEWRKFDSGSAAINAVASGDVDIAVAGSSPIAILASRGIKAKLFWILEDIADAEALVVRNGTGILAPQDLEGKRLAVPFGSTTHFHALFALEQFNISPRKVKIVNLQPPAIATAWETERIDAAFVWDPALAKIKESGKVLISSGTLSSWGKATFDGVVVTDAFGSKNKEFMKQFIIQAAKADAMYMENPQAWNARSDMVKNIANMVGGDPRSVPTSLSLYRFLDKEAQASSSWLGGGKNGGAARALKFTSEFLKDEKKINQLQRDYSKFVTDEYVKAAM